MSNLSRRIVSFIRNPADSLIVFSTDLEHSLLYCLHIAFLVIALILIFFPFVNVRVGNTFFNNGDNNDYILVEKSAYWKSYNDSIKVSSALKALQIRFAKFERVLAGKVHIGPSNRFARNEHHYLPPVSFFVNVKVSDLLDPLTRDRCSIKFGLSWSAYRNYTQVPIGSVYSRFLTTRLMFDSTQSFNYLRGFNRFLVQKRISLKPLSDETLSLSLVPRFNLGDQNFPTPNVSDVTNTDSDSPTDVPVLDESGEPMAENSSIIDVVERPTFKSFIARSCYMRLDFLNYIFIKVT